MSAEPVVSVRAYLIVWGTLILLTITTTGIAFVDMGAEWNTVAALAIAIGKTVLVVLFFMHLRYSGRLLWVIAGAGVFWLILLIGGTIDDVVTRPLSSPQAVAQSPAAPR